MNKGEKLVQKTNAEPITRQRCDVVQAAAGAVAAATFRYVESTPMDPVQTAPVVIDAAGRFAHTAIAPNPAYQAPEQMAA